MSLIFKPFQSTLANKEGKKNWYPRVIRIAKPVTTYELAENVTELSAMSSGDVLNVLNNLAKAMKRHLQESHSVKLNGIGSFWLDGRARGNGVPTMEEVSSSQFSTIICRFQPEITRDQSGRITSRALVQGATFASLASLGGVIANVADDNDEGGSGGTGGGGDDNNPL